MVDKVISTSKGRSKDSGFSLIELLVVIMIIGILSGIAVLSLSGARNLSQKKACEVDYASTVAALKSYKNDWPESSPNITNLINEGYLTAPSNPDGYQVSIVDGSVRLIRTSDGATLSSCDQIRG